ncbi:hypothetical protein FOZ63_009800 [Perkinsus olseni]|nr:hypothetical protein FOZ63_009800 [Perkinsus olseni]
MGLVSLDDFDLRILMESSEDDVPDPADKAEMRKEKQAAIKLHPLISRHHLLLVTLLLVNSLANEALPLFLDQIVPPYMAVLVSVTLVLVFGEIIPSAVFTGPNQLSIGAAFSPLVK